MKNRTLFSVCPDAEFFGRTREIGAILERAKGLRRIPNVFLAGKRWTGKTEVLRRVHRDLFVPARVVPVYYQFKGPLTPRPLPRTTLRNSSSNTSPSGKGSRTSRNETSLERLEKPLSTRTLRPAGFHAHTQGGEEEL